MFWTVKIIRLENLQLAKTEVY